MQASSVPMVYESRSLVPDTLKTDLLEGASIIESVPEEDKDCISKARNLLAVIEVQQDT